MSGFSNFAVSFSIISILAGCITSYGIALDSGGPSTHHARLADRRRHGAVPSRWRWPRSARLYPTAGGLYCWAGRLAKTQQAAWAWFVGWFNFLGEVAVTAAIDFGCRHHLDGLRSA